VEDQNKEEKKEDVEEVKDKSLPCDRPVRSRGPALCPLVLQKRQAKRNPQLTPTTTNSIINFIFL